MVSTGIISTFAGNGGTGSYSGDNGAATLATMYEPIGVTLDSSGIRCLPMLLSYLSLNFIPLFLTQATCILAIVRTIVSAR